MMQNCNNAILTVVIPLYNNEKFIKQAVDSVLKQSCEAYKIIIVDDGSTDQGGHLADAFQEKYGVDKIQVIHKENGGVSSARNVGISHVKTPYVCFLDADDVLCKDVFNDEIYNILKQEKYDVLNFSYIKGNRFLNRGNFKLADDSVLEKEDIIKKRERDVMTGSLVFHMRAMGTLRFPEGVRMNEDFVFNYLVLSNANSMKTISKPWYAYRNNSSSVSHTNTEMVIKRAEDQIEAWKWCKAHCSEGDYLYCNRRIFLIAVEYMMMACEDNLSFDDIELLFKNSAVVDAMEDYNNLWKSYRLQYEEYRNNPNLYKKKLRRSGILKVIAKKLNKNKVFHELFIYIRYRQNIRKYV